MKPEVERLITLAKRGDLHARRQALAELNQDKFVVHKLFDEIAPRYGARPGRLHADPEAGAAALGLERDGLHRARLSAAALAPQAHCSSTTAADSPAGLPSPACGPSRACWGGARAVLGERVDAVGRRAHGRGRARARPGGELRCAAGEPAERLEPQPAAALSERAATGRCGGPRARSRRRTASTRAATRARARYGYRAADAHGAQPVRARPRAVVAAPARREALAGLCRGCSPGRTTSRRSRPPGPTTCASSATSWAPNGGAHGDVLEFWIEADAFMRHMVRVLVGTMLEVGGGRRDRRGLRRTCSRGRPATRGRRDRAGARPAPAAVTY